MLIRPRPARHCAAIIFPTFESFSVEQTDFIV
jgi:hypothetical protein